MQPSQEFLNKIIPNLSAQQQESLNFLTMSEEDLLSWHLKHAMPLDPLIYRTAIRLKRKELIWLQEAEIQRQIHLTTSPPPTPDHQNPIQTDPILTHPSLYLHKQDLLQPPLSTSYNQTQPPTPKLKPRNSDEIMQEIILVDKNDVQIVEENFDVLNI